MLTRMWHHTIDGETFFSCTAMMEVAGGIVQIRKYNGGHTQIYHTCPSIFYFMTIGTKLQYAKTKDTNVSQFESFVK